METHETSPPPPRRLDAYTRWCVILLSACLILMSVYAAMIWSLRSRIASELDLIRKDGDLPGYVVPVLPTTWPADDAYEDYKAAGLKLKALAPILDENQDLISSSSVEEAIHPPTSASTWMTPDSIKKRFEIIQRLNPYFEDIRRAGTKPQCLKWMLSDFRNDDFVHEPLFRSIMATRAVVAVDPPDPHAFLECVDALLCRAIFVGRGPVYHSLISRSSLINHSIDMFQSGLNYFRFSEPDLAALASRLDLAATDPRIDLPRAAKSQRGMVINSFSQSSPMILDLSIQYLLRFEAVRYAFLDTAYHFAGGIEMDQLACLRRMREEIRIIGLPPMERRRAAPAFQEEDEHVPSYCRYARDRGSALLSIVFAIDDGRQRIDLARTAVAVERYRLAHADRPPDQIQELIPRFLSAVPADPTTGNPVRYTRTPGGYALRISQFHLVNGRPVETGQCIIVERRIDSSPENRAMEPPRGNP